MKLGTTDGDSQGVRCIAAQPLIAQSEDHAHHSCHLLLVRSAMTGNCGFDLGWRILVDVEALPTKHREQSPARLCEDNERACVEAMKGSLESDGCRLPFRE